MKNVEKHWEPTKHQRNQRKIWKIQDSNGKIDEHCGNLNESYEVIEKPDECRKSPRRPWTYWKIVEHRENPRNQENSGNNRENPVQTRTVMEKSMNETLKEWTNPWKPPTIERPQCPRKQTTEHKKPRPAADVHAVKRDPLSQGQLDATCQAFSDRQSQTEAAERVTTISQVLMSWLFLSFNGTSMLELLERRFCCCQLCDHSEGLVGDLYERLLLPRNQATFDGPPGPHVMPNDLARCRCLRCHHAVMSWHFLVGKSPAELWRQGQVTTWYSQCLGYREQQVTIWIFSNEQFWQPHFGDMRSCWTKRNEKWLEISRNEM